MNAYFTMCKQILATLFILFTAIGCTAKSPASISLSEAENGQTINLKQGDSLILTLEGNPSTGFGWEIENLDDAILRLEEEPAFTPDSTAIGSAGLFVWRFEAVAPGQISLRLIYHRAWEDIAPEQVFEVTVNVSG